MCAWTGGTGGRESTNGNWWGVPPGSPNPDRVWDQKKNHCSQPFPVLASKKLCHQYLDQNSSKKDFLKSMVTNTHSPLSFLFIWNWNDTYVHTLPLSLENYLISDLNGQSLYPFLDQNSAKPLPFGVAHTYVAYIWEYPLGRCNGMLTEKVGEHFNRSVVMTCHIWRHTT